MAVVLLGQGRLMPSRGRRQETILEDQTARISAICLLRSVRVFDRCDGTLETRSARAVAAEVGILFLGDGVRPQLFRWRCRATAGETHREARVARSSPSR